MGKKTFNATLLAVIVFAAMMTAFACRNRNEPGYVPDPGCSPIMGGQVCPLPHPSISCYTVGSNGDYMCPFPACTEGSDARTCALIEASPSPSIKAKAADVPTDVATNAPEPKATYVAPAISEPDPQNPTAGGGTGGYAQPRPTIKATP